MNYYFNLKELNKYIDQAESKRKLIGVHFELTFFNPNELRQLNKDGRYLWNVASFYLIDPIVKVEELTKEIEHILKIIDRIKIYLDSESVK